MSCIPWDTGTSLPSITVADPGTKPHLKLLDPCCCSEPSQPLVRSSVLPGHVHPRAVAQCSSYRSPTACQSNGRSLTAGLLLPVAVTRPSYRLPGMWGASIRLQPAPDFGGCSFSSRVIWLLDDDHDLPVVRPQVRMGCPHSKLLCPVPPDPFPIRSEYRSRGRKRRKNNLRAGLILCWCSAAGRGASQKTACAGVPLGRLGWEGAWRNAGHSGRPGFTWAGSDASVPGGQHPASFRASPGAGFSRNDLVEKSC